MPADRTLDVAIVGGGIAGLTVGHELAKQAPHLRWSIFEASGRLGGKLLTERIPHDDGQFIVEGGPDAFLAAKPWATELARELGLESQLTPINQVTAPAAILKHGRIIDLPAGLALAAPTRVVPFACSPLLSPAGKARAALDLALPARRDESDESVGAFIRRRLGPEMLDWIAEPLMAGIYNANPDQLSLLATFPQFAAMERTHRSLIRGLRAARPPSASGARPPAFLTLRHGLQSLVDALIDRYGERGRVRSAVTAIARDRDGYVLNIAAAMPIRARSVVLALPAVAASNLLADLSPVSSTQLGSLRASAAGTISLAFRSEQISRPLTGYGLVIPAREGAPINAITDATRKFPDRAPDGWSLLRVFFGGHRSPQSTNLDDGSLLRMVMEQLAALVGVRGEPAFHRIHRWPAGSPLYEVGHLDRIARIDAALPPGLVITGSPYRGVGIPDIVRDARTAAANVAAHLETTSQSLDRIPQGAHQ